MSTIQHELEIAATASKIYRLLATTALIGAWWAPHTERQTECGLVLEHDPGPEHGVVQFLVVAREPDRRVEWECISTHPASSPAAAWTGTRFVFELRATAPPAAGDAAEVTTLQFRQENYDQHSPFFASNREAWGDVLRSLKKHVEAR